MSRGEDDSTPRRESRLEVAARTLVAILESECPEYRKDLLGYGGAVDRAWLELWEAVDAAAGWTPAPAPLKLFEGDSPSRRIDSGEPGTSGLDVVFGKGAVGLVPVGFEPGIALSYKAAGMLRDVLVEDLGARTLVQEVDRG